MSTDGNACANCGKGEEESGHLKACVACKMVKYCNRECQIAHRPQHKKACKKRAAELHDEALFKNIPPTEDCPICMLPLPHDPMQSCFRSCCGKRICNGCIVAMMVQGNSEDSARSCPFCRKLAARERDRSEVTLLEKLIESGNGEACMQLGSFIAQGDFGLEVDNVKATELFLKAGKLGCAGGYFNLGEFYRAVEVDEKKAKHYYELAAIGGNVYARHSLGSIEYENGNFDRATKHILIAASAGDQDALEKAKNCFREGWVTNDYYAQTLRAYQQRQGEMKSAARDKAVGLYRGN